MPDQNEKEEDHPPMLAGTENNMVSVEPPTEKNVSKHNGEISENEDDNVSVKELIQRYPQFVLKEDTQRYIITANGVPQCYTQTLENARNCMWDLARLEKNNQTDYQCFIREMENPNDIQLVGYHRFYIIAYNRTLVHLSVRRVLEIDEKPDTTIFMEEKSKPTMIGRLLGY